MPRAPDPFPRRRNWTIRSTSRLAAMLMSGGSGQRDAGELSDGLPKSDVVVDGRGDSKSASPVFDRRALLKARAIPKRYKIEPSMGHSMPDILLPYPFDAAEIRIRDPYLRKPHQIRNVHEILLQLIQHADAARLPRVIIETCASDEDDIARSKKRRSNSCSNRGDSSGSSSIGASLITSTTEAS